MAIKNNNSDSNYPERTTNLPATRGSTWFFRVRDFQSTGTYSAIVSKGQASASTDSLFGIFMGVDGVSLVVLNDVAIFDSTFDFVAGKDYVVTVTVNATLGHKVFVDGRQVYSDTSTSHTTTSAANLRLLRDNYTSERFIGGVGDFRVWTRELNASEVAEEVGSPVPVQRASLHAWYPLSTDRDIYDRSGNGYDFTINGTMLTIAHSLPPARYPDTPLLQAVSSGNATANAGVANSASTAYAATATGGASVTAGVAAVTTTARAATATGGASVTAGRANSASVAYAATSTGGASVTAGVASAASTAYPATASSSGDATATAGLATATTNARAATATGGATVTAGLAQALAVAYAASAFSGTRLPPSAAESGGRAGVQAWAGGAAGVAATGGGAGGRGARPGGAAGVATIGGGGTGPAARPGGRRG